MTAAEFETLLESHRISNIKHIDNNKIKIIIIDNNNEKNKREIILNDRMVWVKQWLESISNSEL